MSDLRALWCLLHPPHSSLPRLHSKCPRSSLLCSQDERCLQTPLPLPTKQPAQLSNSRQRICLSTCKDSIDCLPLLAPSNSAGSLFGPTSRGNGRASERAATSSRQRNPARSILFAALCCETCRGSCIRFVALSWRRDGAAHFCIGWLLIGLKAGLASGLLSTNAGGGSELRLATKVLRVRSCANVTRAWLCVFIRSSSPLALLSRRLPPPLPPIYAASQHKHSLAFVSIRPLPT